jgi:alpha-tubulin suppressor-like RCC1 family protein
VLYDFGSFRCWGNGDDGRTAQSSEVDIGDDELAISGVLANFGSDAVDIYTGIAHTCVQMTGGQLICFGRGRDNGQIGYAIAEDIGDDEAPNALGPLPFPVSLAHANARGGSFHNCATTTTGATYCWGRHDNAVLGIPGLAQDIGDDEGPTGGGIVDIGGVPDELSMGNNHSCARIGTSVRCWGQGSQGALGYGNADTIGDDETPSAAGDVPVGANVTQITTGFFHTCALTESGTVRCWGRGANGRLGYGNSSWYGLQPATTPAVIGDVDLGGTAVQIAAGSAHTCALLDDGSVKCWGSGALGQLGYGNTNDIGDDELPSSVGAVPLPGPATQIAADANHSCAVVGGNSLYCWGLGQDGRLGYGNLNSIGDDETPSSAGPVAIF